MTDEALTPGMEKRGLGTELQLHMRGPRKGEGDADAGALGDGVRRLVNDTGRVRGSMAKETDRVTELEMELTDLMEDVERYRCAAEDALQQLDWCIGYFAGIGKGQIARVLGANRANIRRKYLKRAELTAPAAEAG